MQEAKVDVSMLNEGHKKAIVQMYANGTRIPDLASWYKVSQAVIREVLKPHIRFA
jgi:Mor family transcriptional regulator